MMIVLNTNYGAITVELNFEKAPISAENFKKYVKDGFYEGTIFHRVIDNFMVQGGGFEAGMVQKYNGSPIENEADNGLSNLTGTLAMARTSDPHSATSQFFINVGDNLFLDHRDKSEQGWGYAVFGRVVDGMKVIDAIKACETGSNAGHQDVPVDDIVIQTIEIQEN
jgi:peptidyl-prolyl cis-trans isomerase B (cyclophilin B)